jgi:hypothetical protein
MDAAGRVEWSRVEWIGIDKIGLGRVKGREDVCVWRCGF